MRFEDEIQQKKFKNEHLKAGINVLFTASWISKINAAFLKPYNISIQQFNILRILRGMGDKPASIKLLMERMFDKMSNASRLVDKLQKKELVERVVSQKDRRQVDIFITKKGLDLLEHISDNFEAHLTQKFITISEKEAEVLNTLLDKLRN